MKRLLFTGFAIVMAMNVHAQLANSVWKGDFLINNPVEGNFVFEVTTAHVEINGNIIETMEYHTKGDTLYLTKLDGMSPCEEEDEAVYTYSVDSGRLIIKVVKDGCEVRKYVFPEEGFELVSSSK